ncbi:MAG: hypothetical protein M3539_10690 [Acidobacteriota bacterium]|nr:hypothetical protein [Acidobacteriota bacterium]
MQQLVKGSTNCLPVLVAAVFTLILCLSIPLHAQRRIISEQERNERDLAEREFLLRTLGKFKKKDLEVGPREMDLQQIKKDFEGLQLANNSVLRALASKHALDHRQISTDVSNIRRRASGLKAQLSLPPTDSEKNRKHNEPLDQPLRAALLNLDAFVISFVSNPIFKDSAVVVDVSHSAQARRDLENIIDLSERIRKSLAQRDRTQKASLARP